MWVCSTFSNARSKVLKRPNFLNKFPEFSGFPEQLKMFMTMKLKMYELQSLLMDFQQLSLEAVTLAQGALLFFSALFTHKYYES